MSDMLMHSGDEWSRGKWHVEVECGSEQRMIEIHPNALYSRQDLLEMLRPFGMDADTFTARLRPRRVFRAFLVGQDILDALAKSPGLPDHKRKPFRQAAMRGRSPRGATRRGAEDAAGMQAIKDAIAEVKGKTGNED
ncbi:MAG: hypothetical protein NTW86_15545 [Candidatus Sumerlaeota bacterium]|nr:hypothetical protein [Candidatus Sumerlaeota bacterium]